MKAFETKTKIDDVIVAEEPRTWMAPKLNKVGSLSEVLAGGGGKLSMLGDPGGDSRKNSGGM